LFADSDFWRKFSPHPSSTYFSDKASALQSWTLVMIVKQAPNLFLIEVAPYLI